MYVHSGSSKLKQFTKYRKIKEKHGIQRWFDRNSQHLCVEEEHQSSLQIIEHYLRRENEVNINKSVKKNKALSYSYTLR